MRSRRLAANDGSSSHLEDSNHSASLLAEDESTGPDGSRDKKWTTDRSRNQEMIMSMYKDGGVAKTNESKDSGSSSDLGKDLDDLGISEHDIFSSTTIEDASGGTEKKRRSALSKLKKLTKKKDLQAPPEEEDTGVPDTRNIAGRSRGTLLERIGAVDEPSDRSSAALRKGGSNYSDRILMGSSKR